MQGTMIKRYWVLSFLFFFFKLIRLFVVCKLMNIKKFEVCVENIKRATVPTIHGLTFSCPDSFLEGLNTLYFV